MDHQWINIKKRKPKETGYYMVFAPDYFDSERAWRTMMLKTEDGPQHTAEPLVNT